MLLIVAIGDIPFLIVKSALPSRIGILFANLYLSLPQWMGDEKFLGKQMTACPALGIHIAVIVLATEFLLLMNTLLPTRRIIGIEVDRKFSNFTCVVKISLMFRGILVAPDT